MTARIIDGAALAKSVRAGVADHTAELLKRQGIKPGLAVVLVGENPASQVYVRNKSRACEEVGFQSYTQKLPATATEVELLGLIAELNENPQVHGILVQLPLPPDINESSVINAIHPIKDVDGFHPVNAGRLASGLMSLVPCTPQGCMMLIREVLPDMRGKKALVVAAYPVIGEALKDVSEYSRSAKLTGTGACVFGEFAEESAARAAAENLSARWRVFVAKGANRSLTHRVLDRSDPLVN